MKQILQTAKTIILALLLAVGISIVHAAWTGPTQAPPAGNTPAPVNVGMVDQVKSAGLGVNALSVSGNIFAQGYVDIGESSIACDETLSGAVRYNASDKCLEMCNGSAWGGVNCVAAEAPLTTVYYPAPNDPSNNTTVEPTHDEFPPLGWNTVYLDYSNGVYNYAKNIVGGPAGAPLDLTYASFTYTGNSDTGGIIKTAAPKMIDMDTGDPILQWARFQFYQDDVLVWEATLDNGLGSPKPGSYGGGGIRGWIVPSTPIDLSAAGVDFSGTHTYYFKLSTANAKWWISNFYLEFEN